MENAMSKRHDRNRPAGRRDATAGQPVLEVHAGGVHLVVVGRRYAHALSVAVGMAVAHWTALWSLLR